MRSSGFNPFFKSLVNSIVSWCASPRVTYLVFEPFFLLLGRRRNRTDIELARVQRALVVRLDEIGDVVLTTSFLRELRRNLPNAWIALVVKAEIYNLVECCPYVNEVLTYSGSGHGIFERRRRALTLAWKRLWPRRFDLAILQRWDTDWYDGTLLAYLSGAQWRIGYSERVSAEKQRLNAGFDRLLTHLVVDGPPRHEVERNLDVLRFLGGSVENDGLELWLTEGDEKFAAVAWQNHHVRDSDVVVGLGPSSGNAPLKQWPVSNFVDLARWLATEYQARVLIVGGPSEEPVGDLIKSAAGPSVFNMAGKTSLRQTAALLKRCQLFVGNDGGPMHLAAAVRVPTVALFGSSCHHRFGPWGQLGNVLWSVLPCSQCFQDNHGDRCRSCPFDRVYCMLAITVDQTKGAVARVLEENSKRYPSKHI